MGKKLDKILDETVGDGRSTEDRRTDDYQTAEGMIEPGSTLGGGR